MAVNFGAGLSGAAGGAAAGSAFGPIGTGIGAIAGGLGGLFGGGNQQGKFQQRPLLSRRQRPVLNQLINASQNPGAGGAFGQSADYYRNLLSDNPEDFQAFAAPEMRRFNEDIIPGLAEQFAGMGSGGLQSSGFRNAAVNAGTDLSERLGAIRASLRQQGVQGLFGIGQQAVSPQYTGNLYRPPAEGGFNSFGQGLGNIGTQFVSDRLRNTSPYGNQSISRPAGNFNQNQFSAADYGAPR